MGLQVVQIGDLVWSTGSCTQKIARKADFSEPRLDNARSLHIAESSQQVMEDEPAKLPLARGLSDPVNK